MRGLGGLADERLGLPGPPPLGVLTYPPDVDSYLLAACLPEMEGRVLWDLGCGSGTVGLSAGSRGAAVIFTDVQPFAVRAALRAARRVGLRARGLVGDLLAPYRVVGWVDVLAFNPPYLPTKEGDRTDPYLDAAIDGGMDGAAVTRRFLDQLETAADRGFRPEVYLLASSLSGIDEPLGRLRDILGHSEIVVSRSVGFETIAVIAGGRP